jgi:electron transfer flavoprotein beta subunit
VLTADEIGIDFSPRNKVVKVEEPATRKAGVFVESTADLVDKLRNEASVI